MENKNQKPQNNEQETMSDGQLLMWFISLGITFYSLYMVFSI